MPGLAIGDELTSQSQFDMLYDDALLAIFDFCVDENGLIGKRTGAWQTLVHVCHRWRSVVFGSSRRLNLRLFCSGKTPARDMLDVWPALPLLIRCHGYPIQSVDNIIAVLERSNRVLEIDVNGVSSSDLEKVSASMQEAFPALTHLRLERLSDGKMVAALPDSFSGGSVPHLRFLFFRGIPFPGLPKLLLSATYLVTLRLCDIPHSGYFSPDVMVATLSTLTSLEDLLLHFQSPLSFPDESSRHPPLQKRFILPILALFSFKGTSDYLDDLVAHIDVPQLSIFQIIFFNQIVFDTPQFIQFISRTPVLKALKKTRVVFGCHGGDARVKFLSQTHGQLGVKITCIDLDWQVSSLEQVCTWCLPSLSKLEDLYISEELSWRPNWQDNIENTLWLELLHPFTAVKNLYLSEEFARRIVPALLELVEGRMTEVLPALQTVFLEGLQTSGPVQEGIGQFVAMRQASHPIAVSRWKGQVY